MSTASRASSSSGVRPSRAYGHRGGREWPAKRRLGPGSAAGLVGGSAWFGIEILFGRALGGETEKESAAVEGPSAAGEEDGGTEEVSVEAAFPARGRGRLG